MKECVKCGLLLTTPWKGCDHGKKNDNSLTRFDSLTKTQKIYEAEQEVIKAAKEWLESLKRLPHGAQPIKVSNLIESVDKLMKVEAK